MTSEKLTNIDRLTEVRSDHEAEKVIVHIAVEFQKKYQRKRAKQEEKEQNTLIQNRYLLDRERKGRKGSLQHLKEEPNFFWLNALNAVWAWKIDQVLK